MKVSGQPHALAAPPPKERDHTSTEEEAGWAIANGIKELTKQ